MPGRRGRRSGKQLRLRIRSGSSAALIPGGSDFAFFPRLILVLTALLIAGTGLVFIFF